MYNVGLNLSGKDVLVVGAGSVAERKIKSIIEEGCKIKVISTDATEYIKDLAEKKRITLIYQKADAGIVSKKYFIIFATTSDPELNREICNRAISMNILCNDVSDHNISNFISLAVIKFGYIDISIGTGGMNPRLSKTLKNELYDDIINGGTKFVTHIKYLLDN